MQTNETKITTADPSALGLFGLAIVTLVASSQKLGLTTGTSLIIPWSLFLGASAQLIAGILDSKRNNVFGTTVFTSYGLFWLGVTMTWMINLGVFGEAMANSIDIRQLGFAFIGFFIFSLIITIASMKTNKVLFIDFILIDLLFLGLSFEGRLATNPNSPSYKVTSGVDTIIASVISKTSLVVLSIKDTFIPLPFSVIITSLVSFRFCFEFKVALLPFMSSLLV